jgi:hypothetical protein
MADSLLADYILESTGYLSALSKTLPAIYPLYQRPYRLSILSQGKIQIYRLSILHQKVQVYRLSILPIGKTPVYWLFILLGKLKSPLQVHTYSIILNGVLKFKFNKSRPQFRLTLSSS